ncbi:MAG: tail fiber domain-containing protein [Lachnospiraceae bacterium]|nr:tail fiber domain-containing protein [Lachnospiraceae bacterium]
MNNKWFIGKHTKSVTTGAKRPPISKVILNGDNDTQFIVGDDSGDTLETFVPTATQQMANDIFNRVKGFEYQGYTASGAFIPPQVELGDGVTVGGVYGVLASREFTFTPKLTEAVSAPFQNEEDHEYDYSGSYAKDIANKVQQGKLYYGTRITKQNGLEIVKTDGNIEKSRVILNSDQLVFYNDNGQEAFYFDAPSGVFRLTQYADIEGALDGSSAFSTLEFTAQQLRVELNDAKGNIASLQLTATQLQSQITDNYNQLSSTITQTASSIRTEISDTKKGLTSTIEQTASSLQAQINSTNGNVASLQLTATQLQSQITSANGNISVLQQTATNLSSRISSTNSYISEVEQSLDSIYLSVSNGSESSTIRLVKDGYYVSSANISFTGMVTFSDLSGQGMSTINGSNITTGTINANYVSVSGQFQVGVQSRWGGLEVYGYVGCGYGNDGTNTTYGAMMSASGGNNYVIATNAGTRMTAGGNAIFCTAHGCYSSQEFATSSDRRVKTDISYDLSKYKELLLKLRPAKFKLVNDPNKLYHTGYIAQDLEQAMQELGMPLEDFAGLAYSYQDGEKQYYIRYGEFVSIVTALLQEIDKRLKVVEGKL